MDGDAKQRTGNGYIVLGEVLFEVFEAAEGGSAFLNLVNDDDGILRHDVHAGMSRECADDARDVVVRLEDGFGNCIFVQVYIGDVFVLLAAKLFKDVCLAYLTGSVKHKWFVVSTILPLK